MTDPHHPCFGQQLEIIRVQRTAAPQLIFRLPDGSTSAIAASWTSYPDPRPSSNSSPTQLPLLELNQLRQLSRFVKVLRLRLACDPSLRHNELKASAASAPSLNSTLLAHQQRAT